MTDFRILDKGFSDLQEKPVGTMDQAGRKSSKSSVLGFRQHQQVKRVPLLDRGGLAVPEYAEPAFGRHLQSVSGHIPLGAAGEGHTFPAEAEGQSPHVTRKQDVDRVPWDDAHRIPLERSGRLHPKSPPFQPAGQLIVDGPGRRPILISG